MAVMALHATPPSVSFRARPASAFLQRSRASAGGSSVPAVKADGGVRWWAAPLLRWSGRADYLEVKAPPTAPVVPARDNATARGRRASTLMTEEKAREICARMAEAECFHDAMYHSAIASRLARP